MRGEWSFSRNVASFFRARSIRPLRARASVSAFRRDAHDGRSGADGFLEEGVAQLGEGCLGLEAGEADLGEEQRFAVCVAGDDYAFLVDRQGLDVAGRVAVL